MRVFLFVLLFLTLPFCRIKAQQEVITADTTATFSLSDDIVDYDGFLLDMGILNATSKPKIVAPSLLAPSALNDYSWLLYANPHETEFQELNRKFSLNHNLTFDTGNSSQLGFSNFWTPGSSNLLKRSYKLNNGMQLNTYGQYNQNGYRIHQPGTLPWQKNRFQGAFELKSADGKFGIRIEATHY